jgi:Zn-dependent M16 (insulinase) family peptidase
MRLLPLFLLALATCCPPAAKKPIALAPGAGSGSTPVTPPASTELSLATLQVGVSVHGFTPAAVYLDANDQPIGARLVHDKTKFIFDYLRIESAPQGFIWVNSFPTSDKGEPHTQEHLLLGKGNRGRKMGSFQAMSLTESSAFTDQWRTAYHFHTVAGRDAFWPVFADQIGAMLDADYTDEEIRREVRNFGVDKGDDGKLRLEEKGTVYNEMVRYYEQPDTTLWLAAKRLVYGAKHPLAFESGGYPDDIRTMTPEDIRKFHGDNYHLANMGMIATFPSAMTLTQVLDGTDQVLTTANQRTGKVTTEADLPKPAAASTETPITVDYPYSDTAQPSPMVLAWPATRGDLDLTERTLLDLFLSAFAGDESTPLYKKLIDSKTRTMDLGASSLGASMSGDQGYPIYLFVSGVRTDKLDPATLAKVRAEVMAELARIAKLPDGDPELAAIKKRIEARATDMKRQLAKYLDSPPGFGTRGTNSGWMNHLDMLAKVSGAKKSLTLRPELAAIDRILAGGGNPWRTRLTSWGLLVQPFVAAAKPSTKLRKDIDAARDARIAAELARLGTEYKTKDKAATLAKYQVDYDKQTKLLEDASAATPLPPLVQSPPMTYDDELKYTTSSVGGVPAFTATIDSMQSARVALAFDLRGVDPADQMYLALLPSLLEQVGIADGKEVIKSEDMRERLRTEILELSVGYSEDLRTNRAELVVAGAGNTLAETKLALGWMRRVMTAPDWRTGNLPRLRDVVDQSLTALRSAMQGSEEGWVNDPHDAWWRQDSLLHLHINSFLTQAHDLHRLRWQLLDPLDAKVTAEVSVFLGKLSEAGKLPRAQLALLAASLVDAKAKAPAQGAPYLAAAAKLSPQGKALAIAAGKDLTALLADLPDGSLAADWAYLCKQMAADLEIGAPAALAKLAAVRAQIVRQGRARITAVGATKSHAALAADLTALVGLLPEGGAQMPGTELPAKGTPITDRLRDHDKGTGPVTYVGLFSPATSSGVFINNAPAPSLADTSEGAVLDYLTSNMYSGHGAHSLFMKTWAAGLAYSNGAHPFVSRGQLEYYAERCPLLPQTLRFVISQLQAAKPDPNIARYAIAHAFDSRIAKGYEERAMAMADDLVDGWTPGVVTAFRKALLAQTDRADLAQELFERMPAVYGKVLPGYGTPAKSGAINFVIGPAKQLDAYQAYLRSSVDKAAVVHRLYPRDFWIPAKL